MEEGSSRGRSREDGIEEERGKDRRDGETKTGEWEKKEDGK